MRECVLLEQKEYLDIVVWAPLLSEWVSCGGESIENVGICRIHM